MALGPWTGLYTSVQDKLMDQRRDQELLLLMAIAKHADPLGFCFPGRKELMRIRHCSKDKYDQRVKFLIDECYIVLYESYDHRRRQVQFDFMVSPRVIYVRSEIQGYCEAVFDGALQERDFGLEKNFLGNLSSTKDSLESTQGNLFSTKDSQPESHPDSVTRFRKPESGIQRHNQNHNQLSPSTKTDQGHSRRRIISLHESAQTQRIAQDQTPAGPQRTESAGRDYDALFQTWYYCDDETLARELRTAISTSITQARKAILEYPRDAVVRVMLQTLRKRDKGELDKPGGWFFKTLKSNYQDKDGLRIEDEDRTQPPDDDDYAEMQI